jgi:hypothetical protein
MMAKIDKFLIAELQERGYDLDYKILTEIYKASRNRTDYLVNKKRKEIDEALIAKIAEKMP